MNYRVLAIEPLSRGRYRVCLDNETDLCLYKKELQTYDLAEGSEISEDELNTIKSDILIPRVKSRAMHLMAKKDYSRAQLTEKLKDGGYGEDLISAAIEYLDSFHYLDDDRLCRSYIRFYQDSRSKNRIKQDLIKKGIDKSIIDNAISEEYQNDEFALIKSLMIKRGYDPETADMNEKAKMYRFLISRGFSSGEVSKALKQEW